MGAIKRALAYGLWAQPQNIIGVCVLWFFWATGSRVFAEGGGVFVVVGGAFKWLARWFKSRKWGAFTCGFVVLCWMDPPEWLKRHELTHVRQSLRWGPIYWPAYGYRRIRYGYAANPFEQQARLAEDLSRPIAEVE